MSYLRTFFERPLKQNHGWPAIVAIDFDKISLVQDDFGVSVDGYTISLTAEAWLEFIPVFEQYCRDMQSLERGPVKFLGAPGMTPPEMPKSIGVQKVIADPAAMAAVLNPQPKNADA